MAEDVEAADRDPIRVTASLSGESFDQARFLELRQAAIEGARSESHSGELPHVLNQRVTVLRTTSQAGENKDASA